MTVNLSLVAFLIVAGLSAFIWMYRRGKVAVLLAMARAELKKIKRIQESSDAIDAETQKKLDQVADRPAPGKSAVGLSPPPPGGGNPASRLRNFWLRDD